MLSSQPKILRNSLADWKLSSVAQIQLWCAVFSVSLSHRPAIWELKSAKCELTVVKNISMILINFMWFIYCSWDQRKPTHERMTLLKSAFVHKKHRVQYEIRTYFKFMHFHRLTGSTLSTFLEYIERNLPEGVALKATKVEILDMPEHLKTPPPAVNIENNQQ